LSALKEGRGSEGTGDRGLGRAVLPSRIPSPVSRFPNPDLFTMLSPTLIGTYDVIIDIGEIPILVRTDNADFANMLACRYGEFVASNAPAAAVELEIRLVEPGHGIRNSQGARSPRFEVNPRFCIGCRFDQKSRVVWVCGL